MHHVKRFFVFSFVFSFCAMLSLWTYPHKMSRGIASFEPQEYQPAVKYDASYKL